MNSDGHGMLFSNLLISLSFQMLETMHDSASWVQTIWHNAVQGQTWCKTARTFSIY
jgi:hypothetical protein